MNTINDTITNIMYNIFSSEELLNTLKINATDSNLLLCIDLHENQPDSVNINLFKKLKKSEFIKKELPKYKKVTSTDKDSSCCICLEEYKVNTYKRNLTCSHHFHKKCIDKWFRNCQDDDISCPMCRSKYELKLDKISSFVLNNSTTE
jgi:hypothetical protein